MKKNTLETTITFFSFSILFITILVHSAMDIEGFRRDFLHSLSLRSQSLGMSMRESIENVLRLGLEIRDVGGVAEKSRSLVEANPEITYCIITDLDGVPIYSSDESYKKHRFNSIIRSFTSSGPGFATISIGNDKFYDTVVPVMSVDQKLVAQIHVGFPKKNLDDKVRAIIIRSVLMLILFLIITFSLVMLFVKRRIMQPVTALLNGVKGITDGAFDTRIQKLPVHEFNELAVSINHMAETLQSRGEEIRENCDALENTNTKLNDSYLKLEEMSLELERSEDLYRSLMKDSSDAIVVIDGSESVKMVNKMAEELFGYASVEMEKLPLSSLLLLLNVEKIQEVHRSIMNAVSGQQMDEELGFVNRAGRQMIAKFSASSIRSGDERLVQAIFRDVTNEKQVLRNLEKSAEDLVQLNKMKDSFLGLASHELKTPLTVIMGYSELIVSEMSSGMDPSVVEMVKNIASAAARLDNMVTDMVDVSMIDERRLRLKLKEVNVNDLVEVSVRELRFFFSLRNQEIVTNLDYSIPSIHADNLRLMQLLSNILGNAIKFTPDGGKITISTGAKYLVRKKHEKSRESTLYVEIVVKDTGIGIDRDEQVRIFDKFYEVGNIEEHSSGKVAFKSKGAGLGLAIAKGIVEMHAGEIWVESSGYDPHSFPGSAFHIFLPVDPPEDVSSLNYMSILN